MLCLFHPFLLHLALSGGAQRAEQDSSGCCHRSVSPCVCRFRRFFPAVDCRPSKHASLWLIHFTPSALSSYASPCCYFRALCTVLSLALVENVLIKCRCLGLCLPGLCRAPWHEEFWDYGPYGPFSAPSRGKSSRAQEQWQTSLSQAGEKRLFSAPEEFCGVLFVSSACW